MTKLCRFFRLVCYKYIIKDWWVIQAAFFPYPEQYCMYNKFRGKFFKCGNGHLYFTNYDQCNFFRNLLNEHKIKFNESFDSCDENDNLLAVINDIKQGKIQNVK